MTTSAKITSALDDIWASKPAHLHRLELFVCPTGHFRIDLDCNWEEDFTIEQKLAQFGSDLEMRNRWLAEKQLTGKSLSTVIGKRLFTETKHIYFEELEEVVVTTQRVKRAVELLPDMARSQPLEAHHREIDINEFKLAEGASIHVSQLGGKWDSLYLLPANYHRAPKPRVLRANLPRVA